MGRRRKRGIAVKSYEELVSRCLREVVPSQRLVRPEVMAAYGRSQQKYRDLYKRLARGK